MNAPEQDFQHRKYMTIALALARRGAGTTWPNPSVGCVLVRDNRIVGRGATGPGGRPHAEVMALTQAGANARGATAYVTLEPCAHWGRTPPCVEALLRAGVAGVVVALADPDHRVSGRSLALLRDQSRLVESGVLEDQARRDLLGFLLKTERSRPLVTLKLATTLDGKIATSTGESRWITGEAARKMVHVMRGRHDAVMVGIGTALADDPDLNCRLAGFRPFPVVRVVIDSKLRLPLDSRLVRTARESPTWVVTTETSPADREQGLAAAGVKVLRAAGAGDQVDLSAGLRSLAHEGLTSVFVEGGGKIAASLLKQALADRVAWFHAPAVMGDDAIPGVHELGFHAIRDMVRFKTDRVTVLGDDVLTELSAR